jgi:TRAP-type mannitol/chloroaromatic compound transport system substrate-binding protein
MKERKAKFAGRQTLLLLFAVTLVLSLAIQFSPCPVAAKDKVFNWRMQLPWPEGSLWADAAKKMAERIIETSNGRLNIKVFPVGALVGMREQFNALSMGVFEAHIWPTGYGTGKIPASTFFMSVPGGFTSPTDFRAWYYTGGGLDMAREVYASFGIRYVSPVVFADNPPRFSRKPIRTLADFKGLKIRATPGLQTAVMKTLGASPVYVPADEVFTSLDKGVFDAVSGYTTYGWYRMGLHDIVKYISQPGFVMGSIALELSVNLKAWKELPPDLQGILEVAAKELDLMNSQADWVACVKSLNAMKAAGLKTYVLPDQDIAEMRKIAHTVVDEFAKKDPLAQKVWDSQKEMLKNLGKL